MEIGVFNLQHSSVLKAQPEQRISNIYIYLYVSYQSVYTGSEIVRTSGALSIYTCRARNYNASLELRKT